METYQLACSAILSGCEKAHGQAMLNAVQMAVHEVKDELPFHLQLVWDDEEGTPEKGIQVARRFIHDKGVLGVVGPMGSTAAIHAAPLFHEAGLTHITTAASHTSLSRQGYRTFFRMIASDDIQAREAIRFISCHLQAETMAVIYDETPFAKGLGQLYLEEAEKKSVTVTAHLQVELEKEDYREQLKEFMHPIPQVILFAILEPEGKRISGQLRELGVGSILMGTDALKPSHYLVTPGHPGKGPYHTNASTDIFQAESAWDFANRYQSRYGEKYSIYTAEAYDAAHIIMEAMKKETPPTRSSVLEGVKKTTYQGSSGSISFTPAGERKDATISFYVYENGSMKRMGYPQDLFSSCGLSGD